MKKLINWFKQSNRYKHLLVGILIGTLFKDISYAILIGVIVATAFELKDKQHNCVWDWVDWSLTILGSIIGFTIANGCMILFNTII